MRKLFIRMGWTVLAVLAAIQLYRPERTNPPTDPGRTIQAYAPMPPATRDIFERACADCHSNETRWPWYSHVAPASWLLVSHVDDARRHLNVSDWARYTRERATEKLGEICEEASKRQMPLPSYLWIHHGARLSQADIQQLCDWSATARTRLQSDGGGSSTE